MESTTSGTEDRISDFPDEILHQILSFLSMEDAAQTSVLSRRWKHIWDSYPVFDFCQKSLFGVDPLNLCMSELPDISKQIYPRYWETFEKIANIVDKKLEKFSKFKFGIQKFKLSIALVDPDFDPFLTKWIEVAIEKHVKELDLFIIVGGGEGYPYLLPEAIFAAKSLTVLKVRGYNIHHPVLKSAVDLHSLQSLCLEKVNIDEEIVQNLISGCPFVEDLCLSFPDNLDSLNVSGLVKLVNLSIKMGTNRYLPMKLYGCPRLQRLSLDQVILDCILDDANFPHIEFIFLSRSQIKEGSKIYSHQLKTLIIDKWILMFGEEVIFAPNLMSVELPITVLLPYLNAHCKLKVKSSARHRGELGTPWFIKLKEHLRKQNQTKTLEISFNLKEVAFDREEAEKSNCPSPPHALECLVLDMHSSLVIAMMDGFFWCCRPQVLSLKVCATDSDVKFLLEMFKDIEDEGCCSSSEVKCWRHSLQLSHVMVEDNEGIEEKVPLCWDEFTKAVPNRWPHKNWVHFHLTW